MELKKKCIGSLKTALFSFGYSLYLHQAGSDGRFIDIKVLSTLGFSSGLRLFLFSERVIKGHKEKSISIAKEIKKHEET